MVTQLQPDVRAYLHGGEVIKRYIRVEEVAHEYGFSVEETEYIAKAASSLYKLTRIHLVKKERFDEFMKHIYKVPGTNKQIIKKFARIGEASIIYSIGRHRFIELARAAGATYKINEGTGAVVNEAVTEMNGVEHQFTEEEKNFVVQFAFRSGSKEDTISLIEALAHSADKAESDEIMVTYRSKYDMKPAWVEQVENLLVALEMYRIEEEKAINHLADILTAYGIDVSAEEIRTTETETLKTTVREKVEVR